MTLERLGGAEANMERRRRRTPSVYRAGRRSAPRVDFLARSGTRSGLMVAFEVDRFEWVDERLVVVGRWFDLRGHRFMRPALTVAIEGERDDRRLLADLEHKPWAADEGDDWIAAFPWDGEPIELARAELAVAPTVAVDLPVPQLPGRRKRAPKATAAREAHRPREEEPAAAVAEPERDAAEIAALTREVRKLTAERDALAGDLERAVAERDALARRRDDAAAQRDAAIAARDAARSGEAEAIASRDDAHRSLRAMMADRDRLTTAREDLLRERDSARAARQRDLETIDRGEPPRLPPAAPRAMRRQSVAVLWLQRLAATAALAVFALVVYTLLKGVV
jgi:hypothetical protein